MGLVDWIKDRFDGDQKPAPAAKPVQGPGLKPSQAWPGLGAPSAVEKAVGAKPLGATPMKPAPVGNAPSGVPKAISQSMGPKFEAAAKEYSTPTSAERQVLTALGWQLPQGANPEPNISPYKTDDPTALASFSYLPEKEEVERIEEVYRGMPGYTAPNEVKLPNKVGYFGGLGGMDPTVQKAMGNESTDPTILNDVQSAALTWDEYDKLSEDQRQAVDFNTLLVRAREQDLTNSQAVSDEQRKTYDNEVKTIFGDAGGSKVYAPNTVGLLKQIDFTAVGQDLDEYLSLERAFTPEELKGFSLEDAPELKQMGQNKVDYSGARSRANLSAADATAVTKSADAIQKAMTDANTVLDSFYSTMEQNRIPILDTLGGKPLRTGEQPVGFPFMGQTYAAGDANGEKAAFFNNAYASAAAGKMDEVWSAIEGFTPQEQQELFDYLDQRSQQEKRWGRPTNMLIDTPELTYANPEKTRANIGLGG